MGHPVLRLFDGSPDTSPELGDDVKELQTILSQDGLSLDVDGVFDRATESAVKRFQSENDLMTDGVAGPLTWAALTRTEPPDLTRIFLTTFPVIDPSLAVQLTEALKYKQFLDNASAQSEFPPSLFGGIGSRESNWGLALKPIGPAGTGDFARRRFPTQFRTGPLPSDGGGFGRGLMQIDFDSQEFARTGNWQDPEANVLCSS
jgi:peptidoglycan hydrolase-like protein with peptidoglycan-binding domain